MYQNKVLCMYKNEDNNNNQHKDIGASSVVYLNKSSNTDVTCVNA